MYGLYLLYGFPPLKLRLFYLKVCSSSHSLIFLCVKVSSFIENWFYSLRLYFNFGPFWDFFATFPIKMPFRASHSQRARVSELKSISSKLLIWISRTAGETPLGIGLVLGWDRIHVLGTCYRGPKIKIGCVHDHISVVTGGQSLKDWIVIC